MMNKYWWQSNHTSGGVRWLSWNRIAVPKSEGRGFKILNKFNIDLLAKQGWRLLPNPMSIVSGLYQARYFNGKTFLEANRELILAIVGVRSLQGRMCLHEAVSSNRRWSYYKDSIDKGTAFISSSWLSYAASIDRGSFIEPRLQSSSHKTSFGLLVLEVTERGLTVAVAGIPKTIDNDIVFLMASQNPFTIFFTSEDRLTLARKIVQGISDFNPAACAKIALTFALNPSLMDDLTMKDSRRIMELAKLCSEVPWNLPESAVLDPDQSALAEQHPADAVPVAVPESAVATAEASATTAPDAAQQTAVPPLPHATVEPCLSAVPATAPSASTALDAVPAAILDAAVSVDFAAVSARVLTTQSIIKSLKSTVVQMEKVLLEDQMLLQSFETDEMDLDSAR
nr:uncharacterized mitochondrial protein AtMg00310-like [Ipomoea batatas]